MWASWHVNSVSQVLFYTLIPSLVIFFNYFHSFNFYQLSRSEFISLRFASDSNVSIRVEWTREERKRSFDILYTTTAARRRGGRGGGGRRFVPVGVSMDGTAVSLVILRDVVFYADSNHILEKWLGSSSSDGDTHMGIFSIEWSEREAGERSIPWIWSFCGSGVLTLHMGSRSGSHSRLVSRRLGIYTYAAIVEKRKLARAPALIVLAANYCSCI